ncbi:MAG: DUF87 domain-containing protein [Candidatus Rokubacteria bacterium]|nr:DUF87 domain-containing protein [Candidatus Rokubacteria bacterium]
MKLRLADHLALPAEAVTETFGILAARGAGKSNTAAVMAEEMFQAKLPFVVVDPVRAWWGLRSSRDGTGPGLPLPIFGGRRGDVPLERGGGQLVADLVVDQRLSCVLDLSEFESEGAKKQFLLDFARRLYQRNEAPLHLFLEEADDYIPQRPMGRDEPFLLRAWENIVRRGRARGIGCTLITQRSAALNKNVLTQVQTLIPMRTTGPQDIAAIREWVKYHHQGEALLESLPGLEDGEGWVWSPHFLKQMVRVRFRVRETFDSGATPKASASPRPPATLADVDLGQLKTKMAATIEKAKAEDPRELRKQVAELRAQLARGQAASPGPAKTLRVEVPILKDAQIKRLEAAVGRIERSMRAFGELARAFGGTEREIRNIGTEIVTAIRAKPLPQPIAAPARPASAVPRQVSAGPARFQPRAAAHGPTLPLGERRILTAVAQHGDGVTREQLTILTGYKRSSRDTYLQRLRERGLVESAGDRLLPTAEGLAALGSDFAPLPIGDALREHWMTRLPEGERRVLAVLLEAFPKALERESLSVVTGYQRSSRDTYLQRLKARRLVIAEGRGHMRAAAALFDA